MELECKRLNNFGINEKYNYIMKVVQEIAQSEIVWDKWRGREFDHWTGQ